MFGTMTMVWLSIRLILFCIKDTVTYNYPLAAEAQETMQHAVASFNILSSIPCWLNWIFSPKKPEVVEVSYMDSLLIWLGLGDTTQMKEEESSFFVIGFILIILGAIGLVIYMTLRRHLRVEVEKPKLIPFLADNVEYENNDSFPTEEQLLSMKTCSGCACQFCMDETGDMKEGDIRSKRY